MRYINRLLELYPAVFPNQQTEKQEVKPSKVGRQLDEHILSPDTSEAATKDHPVEKPSLNPEKVYLTITAKKLFLQMPNEYADVNFVRKLRYSRWLPLGSDCPYP